MGKFLAMLGGDKRPVWLEATDYAGRLLAGGAIPWFDVAEFLAWQRKTQGLLRADVVVLPLGALVAAWVNRDGDLVLQMRSKQRATWPLKVLLSHEPLRAHISQILNGLRASYRDAPLALAMPSPRLWVAETLEATGGTATIGEDEVDTASVYVADFLRTFGESGLDAVLLEESARSEPGSVAEVAWYQPVINVAGHFRWDLGLRLPVAAAYGGGEAGLGFLVAPRVLPGQPCGVAVGEAFWAEGSAPSDGAFHFADVARDHQPEQVLDRLALLR